MKLLNFNQTVQQTVEMQKSNELEKLKAEYNLLVETAVEIETAKARERFAQEKYAAALKKNKEAAAFFNQTRRSFINLRDQMTDALFLTVSENLLFYVESPAYKNFLQTLLLKNKNNWFSHIQIMERDKIIIESLTKMTMQLSTEDFIGGFKLMTADHKMIADHTLLSLFNQQRSIFPSLYTEALCNE